MVVGGDGPLELQDVREVLGGVAEVDLAAAAVVEAARDDAGRQLEEVAVVAARRDRHQALELAVDVEHVAGLVDLDHRRVAGDRDGFLQSAELQREVDLERGAGAKEDAFTLCGREAGELGGDRERAGRQVDQPVLAAFVGRGGLWTEHLGRGRRDRHAREGAALGVNDNAPQPSETGLRRAGRCPRQASRNGGERSQHPHRNLLQDKRSEMPTR